MRGLRILLLLPVLLIAPCFVQAQTRHLTAAEAKNHVGETATVCGKVVSARFASKSKGQPTFLNLDEPYPNHIFTVVVWGSDREKFGDIRARALFSDNPFAAFEGRELPYIPEITPDEKPKARKRFLFF